ncbi:MAG: restriction endonuclease [Pseudomonadota bacterium]
MPLGRKSLASLKVISALVLALALGVAFAGPQQYWVCLSNNGIKAAQDRPCAPEQQTLKAPPGKPREQISQPSRVLPELKAVKEAVVGPLEAAIDEPSAAKPKAQVSYQPILDAAQRGLTLLVVMVIAIFAIRIALRLRKRRSKNVALRITPPVERIEWKTPVNDLPELSGVRSMALRDRVDEPPQPSAPMSWSMDLLKVMEWKRFEELCLEFWLLKGYPAKLTGPGADGGVDVVITDRADANKTFAIAQCKSHSQRIGVEPVRALWGSKDHLKATLAIFYSVSGFSPDATAFAEGKHLKLIDGDALLEQIGNLPAHDQIALLAKITRGDYTTPSCPKCEIKLVRHEGKGGRPDFWGCKNFRRCGLQPRPVRKAEATL